jgi:secreted trypsin-like serine protease
MKTRMLFAAVLAAWCAVPGTAQAITNGEPDEGRHPWVGALVSYDPETGDKYLICSGTLIDKDVFLTAAHCLEDEPSDLYVSFDEFVGAPDVGPEVKLHHGQAHADPAFDGTNDHDLAVVVLDKKVKKTKLAKLPKAGALDALEPFAAKLPWGVIGYGREGHDDEQGFFGGGSRRFGFSGWLELDTYTFRLSQIEEKGEAGTCNGDSGGPVFLGKTRVLAGVSVDGDPFCDIDSINVRLDTRDARSFVRPFLENDD